MFFARPAAFGQVGFYYVRTWFTRKQSIMAKGPRNLKVRKGSVLTEIKNTSVIDFTDISDEEMNKMIDGTLTDFDEGDLVDGTVVKIEHDEVLVDIGFKSEGVIPVRELSIRKDADPSEIVNLGDKIEALVLQKEDKDGRLILSKKRAEYERAWISVEEKFKAGETVTGEVIEVVKGGLILDIGLRGFLPASLVDLRRVKDLDMYLGTEIEARVIEMDRNRNNVVLSRRVLLEEGRKNERAEILSKLSKGMRLKGTVSSIVDFGAFVDLGGRPPRIPGSSSSRSTRSAPSSTARSPRSFRSARSSSSATASRAWCTSPRWLCATSTPRRRSSSLARTSR